MPKEVQHPNFYKIATIIPQVALLRSAIALATRPIDVARTVIQDTTGTNKATNMRTAYQEVIEAHGTAKNALYNKVLPGTIPRLTHAVPRDVLRVFGIICLDNFLGNSEGHYTKGLQKTAIATAIELTLLPLGTYVTKIDNASHKAGDKFKNDISKASGAKEKLAILYPKSSLKSAAVKPIIQFGCVFIAGDFYNQLFRDKKGNLNNLGTASSIGLTAFTGAVATFPADYFLKQTQMREKGQYTVKQFKTDFVQAARQQNGKGLGFTPRVLSATAAIAVKSIARHMNNEKPKELSR